MPKRYNNIIYKLSLKSKRITKVILSSITIFGLIIYIKDPKKALGIDHVYIDKDTEIEETTIVDITITTYPIRSNTIFIINLDTS